MILAKVTVVLITIRIENRILLGFTFHSHGKLAKPDWNLSIIEKYFLKISLTTGMCWISTL